MGRHGGTPEDGRRLLPKGMYNFYEETIQEGNQETSLEGDEEASEGRRLPGEMYNFYNMDQYQTSPHNLYNMDQYETSSLEEARHKDFDIWLQDFEEQVGKALSLHFHHRGKLRKYFSYNFCDSHTFNMMT